jgi:subtilase family serine protease
VIADANQLAGHPLGFLNPTLYAIGEQEDLFHDIRFGNNANILYGVPGYTVNRGWDFVSGWGTPNLGTLVWKMAQQ